MSNATWRMMGHMIVVHYVDFLLHVNAPRIGGETIPHVSYSHEVKLLFGLNDVEIPQQQVLWMGRALWAPDQALVQKMRNVHGLTKKH